MTNEMRAREKAICEVAKVDDIGEVSDGFHTFNSLYEQRMILFAALVKAYKDKSWKSYRHEDGEYCFGGGWFIVGIDTPEGSYTYHYENKYWDMFDCTGLPRAKHWDRHTEADAEVRLMSLKPERKTGRWIDMWDKNDPYTSNRGRCSICGRESDRPLGDYCKWCGADMTSLPEPYKEGTDNQITACPMCPDCPDNCPLGEDMRGDDHETD